MNREYDLKTRQICMFFVAFLPISKLFMMPSVLSSFSKNDMWISALMLSLLDIFTLLCIILLSEKTGKTFFDLINELFGIVGGKIIFFLYALYFFAKSILPIMEQKNYIEQTLYEIAPSPLFFLPFFFLAFFICTKKLRIIGRVSDVMFFFSILGVIILFALSIKNAEIDAIFPIARTSGKNLFSGSYHGSSWFNDCIYLLFFIGHFKHRKNDGKKIFLFYSLSIIIVIAFCILFYCIFSYVADRQVVALSQLSEYHSVINHSGRFDNIGIILILFSASFSMAFPIYFCVLCLKNVFTKLDKKIIIFTVITFEIIIHYFLYAYLKTVREIIFTFFCPYFLIFGNLIPILISVIILSKRKNYEVNYKVYQK